MNIRVFSAAVYHPDSASNMMIMEIAGKRWFLTDSSPNVIHIYEKEIRSIGKKASLRRMESI